MTVDSALLAAALTPEHARQLDDLLSTLSRDETLWISGYLAGLARQAPRAALPASAAAAALTILYGSETGHAAGLAQRMKARADEMGLAARAISMADFKPQELKGLRHLVILASTHGNGDPPGPAAGFHEFLMGRRAPKLDGAGFAVLGLGDSTYENFCQTGKDFDRRLEELGGRRLHARADCDTDYEEPAAAWIDAALAAFTGVIGAAEPVVPASFPIDPALGELAPTARFDRRTPFPAPLLESLVLNGRGSDKTTRHLEFSLAGSGLTYQPGDSLGVVADNDPRLVEELIAALRLDPAEALPDGTPLAAALTRTYEITALTPRFVQAYGEAAGADRLKALALPENRSELSVWLAGRQIIDVVREFPVEGLEGGAFLSMLRKLQPRLYSLASSLAANPDEAHLCVALVRYDSLGRSRSGVASGYLADRRGIDDTVPVFVESNPNFRLPADPRIPIIMVGAGTGVAPFRAFAQERQAAGADGRSWLFYGDRRFRTDFLYQTEWQRFLKDGVLTRMDVAFSRDGVAKDYVQHRLKERARDLFAWLEEGAHFYVCGDSAALAPDVHRALVEIVGEQGGLSAEAAEDYVKRLQQEKRYQRDVY